MGVHVVLDIDPRGIDKAAWADAYDDTLALLESWQPPLLGWTTRTVEDVQVPVYARSIRHCGRESSEAGWSVVGDRESMRTAERQSFYRDLDHYMRRAGLQRDEADIVVAGAAPNRSDTGGPVTVFGNKTQGYPYHFAMLAAAMLVEERFPHHAMVWGDIDRGQAEQTRKMAAPLLGRELALPVRVDPPRLLERLQTRYEGDALVSAFDRVFLDDPIERNEQMLRFFRGPQGARHWLGKLAAFKTPSTLGGISLLVAWLNAGRDLREACHLACIDPEGPRFPPEDLATALASTWVATPLPLRESLFGLRKRRGESHTVNTLLGSWALDMMGASGRHLRIHIEPSTLTAVLEDAFGANGATLAQRLFAESAKHEEQLRDAGEGIQAVMESARDKGDDSTETLVTLSSPQAMGAAQRNWVHGVACATSKLLAGLLEDKESDVTARLTNEEKARCLLARALQDRGPVLTQDAWDEIRATGDVDVLAWLVALAVVGGRDSSVSEVRRALFENAELRRYAIEAGRDPKIVAEVAERLAAARAEKES